MPYRAALGPSRELRTRNTGRATDKNAVVVSPKSRDRPRDSLAAVATPVTANRVRPSPKRRAATGFSTTQVVHRLPVFYTPRARDTRVRSPSNLRRGRSCSRTIFGRACSRTKRRFVPSPGVVVVSTLPLSSLARREHACVQWHIDLRSRDCHTIDTRPERSERTPKSRQDGTCNDGLCPLVSIALTFGSFPLSLLLVSPRPDYTAISLYFIDDRERCKEV